MTSKKAEPALFLDMDFEEALLRFSQTKPDEVEPPLGKSKKVSRPPPKKTPTARTP